MAAGLLVHHLAEARIPALVASAGSARRRTAGVARGDRRGGEPRRRPLPAPQPPPGRRTAGRGGPRARHGAAPRPRCGRARPGRARRSFTLKDLVRRALRGGGRAPDQPLADWLGALDEADSTSRVEGDDERDRVEDPLGQGAAAYEACAEELDLLARGLRHLLWDEGQAPGSAAPPGRASGGRRHRAAERWRPAGVAANPARRCRAVASRRGCAGGPGRRPRARRARRTARPGRRPRPPAAATSPPCRRPRTSTGRPNPPSRRGERRVRPPTPPAGDACPAAA